MSSSRRKKPKRRWTFLTSHAVTLLSGPMRHPSVAHQEVGKLISIFSS